MTGHTMTRSAVGPLPLNPPDPDEPASSRKTSFDYFGRIQRTLSKNRSARSDTSTSVQTSADAKGPLGLNLLHEPSEPRIDFVFIHGLGGGSKKTWSYSADPSMFWPKEWLPTEAGFKHVRLHSYGYNSDWTSRNYSPLTVHDFGQALLADLHNSPYLRKGVETPIVLVAHSMGGLVAKKAYLLARRDPIYQSTARRVQALYFLATPHRGADSANLAKLVRQYSGFGPKAFLNDLLPGSGTLDQINDEFRHVCGDVELWSFSEGVPTTFGLGASMVVEKDSAILGLAHERAQYIEADHRHICKFDSRTNPNYLILQRAFLTTIEDLTARITSQYRAEYKSQMQRVASFLRVDQRPDATLLATNEKQHAGSCQWLTEHPTFENWVDGIFEDREDIDPAADLSGKSGPATPPILWLHGRPGTGKSVAAGHVIRHLQARKFDCSFYFFRHQESAASNVASLLRSLAFQMAEASIKVRRDIASMTEECIRLNIDDHHVLWTSLFIQRIFDSDHVGPQYWVIDGVDECSKKAIPVLISILSSLDSKSPVRVFMTSRSGGEVGKRMSASQPGPPFLEMTTGEEGTLKDIELFLQSRYACSGDTSNYEDLISDVLSKSKGIFLWASLTIEKLEDAYSVEDKQNVLRQIPPEMDEFYSRIITLIAESQSAELAKCVLTWVVCSPDTLHISELTEAVKMDMGRTLTVSPRQLETMTGHFLVVDNQSRVHIGHETMSRFLTQPNRQGFWIDRTTADTRLVEICLKVLCGTDFAPPKIRRGRPTTTQDAVARSRLIDYATSHFSHYLVSGSVATDITLELLHKFLRSNVLTWIERIASTGSLWHLQQTVQHFKTFLSRRTKDHLPDSIESQTVAAWASDIYHIIVAFGSSLVASPSSIHSLVPYLCPQRSIIHELFAKPSKRLRISGPLDEAWNDRVASHLLLEPTSIACGGRFLAVGLRSGEIKLYNFGESGTFDSIGTLEHGRIVRQLVFNPNPTSPLLASASPRMLKLWDLNATREPGLQCLWTRNLDFCPFSLAFTPDGASILLTNHGYSAVVKFDVSTGEKQEPVLLHSISDTDSDSDEIDHLGSSWSPATRMYLDPRHTLAAMGYRNAVVTIWDIEAMECIGKYEKEGTEGVYCTPPSMSMAFNPIPELELLAISYSDGDLVTCNPWTLETEKIYSADALLDSLTATSDGRVLAGAAEDASIYLFLFKTLQPIYRIPKPDSQFRVNGLAFSADNLRLFDIRHESCNVWEPEALVPSDDADDTLSHVYREETLLPGPLFSGAHAFQWEEGITVIETALDGKILFVGRKDGTVDICEASTGDVVEKLQLHHSSADIRHLTWSQSASCLLSLDGHGRYKINRLSAFGKRGTKAEITTLLDDSPHDIVRQALLSPEATSVLECTDSSVKLIRLDGTVVAEETRVTMKSWWMQHPVNPAHLIAVQGGIAFLFDWGSLELLTDPDGATIQPPLPGPESMMEATSARPWVSSQGSGLVAAQVFMQQPHQKLSSLVAFDAMTLNDTTKNISLTVLSTHAEQLKFQQLLGVTKSNLFFFDAGGWVCSIKTKDLEEATHYTRHFFIPPTWRTGSDAIVKIISKSALAFGRGEQLIVFHGFLEFEEKVPLRRTGGTP